MFFYGASRSGQLALGPQLDDKLKLIFELLVYPDQKKNLFSFPTYFK
jgi:hypothetical protein